MTMTHTVKVAVIGSGLAGLTAAYRIAKSRRLGDVEFEVHLFEKALSVGMDSHSVSVEVPGYEREYRVDVPMRSFQEGYYPQLIKLYEHLGVRFKIADFTYSFSVLDADHRPHASQQSMKTTMIYNGQSGSKGISMPTSLHPSIPAGSSSPSMTSLMAWARAYVTFAISTFFVLICYLRLVTFSLPLRHYTSSPRRRPHSFFSILGFLPLRPELHVTLREWAVTTIPTSPFARLIGLDTRWTEFVQDVIIPLFSAVCTCGEEMVWQLPMEEVLDYVYLTFLTHHYVVSNGVRDVAKRMTSPIGASNVHLGTPIVSLVYSSTTGEDDPTIDVHCVGGKVFPGFSHVIFATQANHATSLLKTYLDTVPEKLETHYGKVKEIVSSLSKITYCKSVVVNHTDSTLMPQDRRDIRDLNLIKFPHDSLPSTGTEIIGKQEAMVDADISDVRVHPSYTMATHILPPPSSLKMMITKAAASQHEIPFKIYQTTNPIVSPRRDTILSVARLERAVVTVESKLAIQGFWRGSEDGKGEDEAGCHFQEPGPSWGLKWGCSAIDRGRLGPLQGAGRLSNRRPVSASTSDISPYKNGPGIWICGSYAHSGIPLLEGCVVSAKNVVEQGIWVSEGVDREGQSAGALW